MLRPRPMFRRRPTLRLLSLTLMPILLMSPITRAADDLDDRTRQTFGELRLIDEVIPGQEQPRHQFTESEPGVSEVREILGRPTRVIPNTGETARYTTYRLGAGMGLESHKAYVLQVEYPEDAPRTMLIHNRGSDTSRGLHTGRTVGDVLFGRYVDHNVESLDYPLSGAHEPFQMLFFLQEEMHSLKTPRGEAIIRDLRPADGVPVIISQWKARNAPLSHGAAVSRVALYEVVDPAALALEINYPPDGLPRRHLFWREEMSDLIVNHQSPGWSNDVDWYQTKAKVMQFLGMNTYSLDMLEFGANQGWDTTPGGPNWMHASKTPQRWERVLRMLKDGGYEFTVMPYYEYAGSIGGDSPGSKKLARPLSDELKAYTHITWSEKAYADVTEPAVLEDAKKVLELTINRWKDVMPFTGAWFRTRPSSIPVSFSDSALAKFSEAMGGAPVTRDQLREGGQLYEMYIAWWKDQRKAFFVALRDHIRRGTGNDDAVILFTADSTEPGPTPRTPAGRKLVTDDVAFWEKVAAEKDLDIVPVPLDEVVSEDRHLTVQLEPRWTWGNWEWQHSVPSADPQNYKDTDGVVPSFSFNRVYTVSSPSAFDAFRTPAGLGIVRHYGLNENEMDDMLGYFVIDMDRTRQHMMHAEVLAVAHGDPSYIGYLAGYVFNRGFPYYARRFNRAYLSLPALPSEVLPGASSDDQVIVRAIRTDGHGTWLAIANTGMHPRPDVTITLPDGATDVSDAATGEPLQASSDGTLRIDMDAAELRSIHLSDGRGD